MTWRYYLARFLCQITNMENIFSIIKALHKYSVITNYKKKQINMCLKIKQGYWVGCLLISAKQSLF